MFDYKEKEQIQLEIFNNKIVLDEPCRVCCEYSRNYFRDEPNSIGDLKKEYKNGEHCVRCDNTRFVTSDVGNDILRFIKRHNKE